MRIWRVLALSLVFALALMGIGHVDVLGAAPAQAKDPVPLTWPVQTCPENSERTSTSKWNGAGYECIANYRAHSNRGRLERILADGKAVEAGAVYANSEGIAEYVAQARIIARLHGSATTHVEPSLQWETTMPGWAGRLDLMQYEPKSPTSVVAVLEVKGKWYKGAEEAQGQAIGYRDKIAAATAHEGALLSLAGYTDTFYRGAKCDAGDASKVDGWRYDVSAPASGVAYIHRTAQRCENREVSDAELAKIDHAENAMELAEDGRDVSAAEMVSGGDANGNGVADMLDVARYAGSGDVQVGPASERYVEWAVDVRQAFRLVDLIAYDGHLTRAVIKYGEPGARRVMEVFARGMATVSTGEGWTGFKRFVIAELSGTAISAPVSKIAGVAVATEVESTVGWKTIGNQLGRVVERQGVKVIEKVLGEAGAKALADMFARYATKMGLTFGAGLVPGVGWAAMLVLDVVFTVQLFSDILELFGYNVWGDPHLVTLDRRTYDLQSVGEFTLARSTSPESQIQGRFSPMSKNTDISVMSRVALGYGGDRFELAGAGALLNGTPLELDGHTITDGGLYLGHLDGQWVAAAPDGPAIVGRSARNMSVIAPDGIVTEGLLGNNDGSPANDLALADGSQLNPAKSSDIHGRFADSWRVKTGESLFTYAEGESTATFTDRSFPHNIVTLGDFTPAEVDAANAACIAQGVQAGPTMEACTLDLLVSGDEVFAAAAAATRSVIDPAAVAFNTSGILTQSFDGAVGANMAPKNVIGVGAGSMAAGPFFDDSPYGFTLLSVPRHDQATVKARLLVLETLPANQGVRSVEINTDGNTTATMELEGHGTLRSGPEGAAVTPDGSGTTTSGTGYRAYVVSVPITHFGDALQIRFQPRNTRAVLGTGLAIDSVEVAVTASPADVASSLAVPFVAGSGHGDGLGSLESAGAEDDYVFSISEATGPLDVLVELIAAPSVRAELRHAASGELVTPSDLSNHKLYRALPVGEYRLVVTSKGGPVSSYELPVLNPAPQVFDLAIGQTVESGQIGGQPVEGAGSLETTASQDLYHVTVPEGGLKVVFDGSGQPCANSGKAKLINDVTGQVFDGVCGHYERDLAAGSYTISISPGGYWPRGGYTFTTYVKPAAQDFDYQVGQKVENGQIGGSAVGGAGNLETTASQDVYHFTVPAGGQRVVFDGSGQPCANSGKAVLINDTTGEVFAGVCGHYERDLAAGSYTISTSSGGLWPSGTYSFTTFVKPVAQSFDYAIGQKVEDGKIGGIAIGGAGNLETTASQDVYHFTVPAGGQRVVFDGSGQPCANSGNAKLINDTTGQVLDGICGHYERDLAAGSYTIGISSGGLWPSGTYTFTTYGRPIPQEFSYQIGQKVESGKIGGVTTPGAGNLETTASQDVYHFTVPAGGQRVVFDGSGQACANSGKATLTNDTTGEVFAGVCGHYERDLAAGGYTINVSSGGLWPSGTYTFTMFVKPAAQSFDYAIGQKVESGKIGGVATAGAGNLETTASQDVYHFTVPAGGQRVVFDGSGQACANSGKATLTNDTTGEVLAGVCGHYERDLAAGGYTISISSGGLWPSGTYVFATFVKPVAQSFDYAIGQKVEDGKIGGVATAGAGNLETTASQDVYHFTVPAGGQRVVFDGSGQACANSGKATLSNDTTGEVLAGVCGHYERDLAAGGYTINVSSGGLWPSGTYAFTMFVKPAAQSFDYAIGQKVESGKIGGVAVAGAGNLETTASQDVYHFTVPAGGQRVVFDGSGQACANSGKATLTNDTTGEVLAGVCGHYERDLAAGGYTISISSGGLWPSGTYVFATFVKPVAQSFDYAIGQKVESGKIGGVAVAGAGNLETTASQDVYHFTVPAGGQRVVFDGSGQPCVNSGKAVLINDTTGETVAGVCGHYERDLAAGSYTISTSSGGLWPSGTYWFSTYTDVPAGPILSKWNVSGGVNGSLGLPTAPRACDGSVCWQNFQGGQIVAVDNSAWITTDLIRQRWLATGGPSGPLGLPSADRAATTAKDGYGQKFVAGSVYERTADGVAHAVLKPIRDAWDAKGWENGYLGYPTGEQQCDQTTGVCWQEFQGGQIMATGTNSWATTDVIRQRWIRTGGPAGPLANPTGHSFTTIRDNGYAQHFQNGEIYGTAATGAHSVHAPILTKWKAANWENGTYAYPLAEQTCTATECSQEFQGGTITAAT